MRKLLLVVLSVGLVMGFMALAYAETNSEAAKRIAKELQNSGTIAPADTANVSSSVKTLLDSGASAIDAKSVVAQAAQQAKMQGLKGKALASRVQDAAKTRKAQLVDAKKKAKEARIKATKEAKQKQKQATKAAKETKAVTK